MAQTVQPIRLVGGDCIGRIYRVIRLIQVNVNGFRWLVRVGFGRANLVQRKPNMKDPVCCIFNNTCFTQTLISSQSFVVPLSFQFTVSLFIHLSSIFHYFPVKTYTQTLIFIISRKSIPSNPAKLSNTMINFHRPFLL